MRPLRKRIQSGSSALIVGISTLFVATTNPAFGSFFSAEKVEPEKPVALTTQTPAVPAPAKSTMSLKMVISQSALRQLAEDLIPDRETGSRGNPIGNPVVNDSLTWDFRRKGLNLTTSGSISISSALAGTVRIRGDVRIIRGSIGKLLGKLNPTNISFSQSAQLGANISVSANPQLTSNWRMRPNISGAINLTEARFKIAKIAPISVRGLVDGTVQARKNALVSKANTEFEANPFLEEEARKLHSQLCKTHTVKVDTGEAWISVRPINWTAQQPKFDGAGLTLGLGVEVETESGLGATPPDPVCPFPPALEIRDQAEAGQFAIRLSPELAWNDLKDQLQAQLEKTEIGSDEGSLNENSLGSITLKNVTLKELVPDGDRILVKVGFQGVLNKFWSTDFEGDLYLHAKPVVNGKDQTLSLQNIELDIGSKKALSLTSVFGSIAGPFLEKQLETLPPVSLKTKADDERKRANLALRKFLSSLKEAEVKTAGDTLDDLKLEELAVHLSGLRLTAVATGKLDLRVDNINLR